MSDREKLLSNVVSLLQIAARANEAAGFVSGVLAKMEISGETEVPPEAWAEIDAQVAAVKQRLDDKIAGL